MKNNCRLRDFIQDEFFKVLYDKSNINNNKVGFASIIDL